MSKPLPVPSSQKIRKDRVFTTKTLYLDASQQKRLFITSTYNFEDSNGEEYLIRIGKWNTDEDEKGIQRLVFVSGSDPHVPIYRSRLHTRDDASAVYLSPAMHTGSRIVYTNYKNSENVAVTRVLRGTFPDSELRGHYSKSELVQELEVFGLQIIEKPKKSAQAKSEHGRKGDLPSVGSVISGVPNQPLPSTSRPSTSKLLGSEPSASKNSSPESCVEPKPRKTFFSPKVLEGIRKKLSQNPVSVDAEESGFTMISGNRTEIDEILCSMLSERDLVDIDNDGYECSMMGSQSPGKILVFNDKKLTGYQLYDGVMVNRVPTCAFTGVRMVLRSS